ncbi:MAG: hypothetical protein ACR2QE_15440 [Acidimicrobiales bacterium]
MSYIVVFPGPDGQEEVVLCASLDAATNMAEDLRNRRNVSDVRLGRVEPVAFTFAPQYRVSLNEEPVAAAVPAAVESQSRPIAKPAVVTPDPEPVSPQSDRVQPGELTAAEIAEMVAIDEAIPELSADDPTIQEALARRQEPSRQRGLSGR